MVTICFTGDNSAESALDNTIEPIQINMAFISQGPNGDHISDIDDVHVPVDDNISEAQSGNLGAVYFCGYYLTPAFVHLQI